MRNAQPKVALNAKWYAASRVRFVSEAVRSLAWWKLPTKETDEYVRAGTIRSSGHDCCVLMKERLHAAVQVGVEGTERVTRRENQTNQLNWSVQSVELICIVSGHFASTQLIQPTTVSAVIEQAWNAICARQTLNPLPLQMNLFSPFKIVYLANTYALVLAQFINSHRTSKRKIQHHESTLVLTKTGSHNCWYFQHFFFQI